MDKVCSVVLTYGNRFLYLKQVIERQIGEGIYKIIVVDNNSHISAKEGLYKITNMYPNRIEIIFLNENKGSAGGIKEGLKKVYENKNCKFILLLDDDNLPEIGFLEKLFSCWNNLKETKKENKVALLSLRVDRPQYLEAAKKNNSDDLLLGKKNSFLGFHFIDIPIKLLRLFPFIEKSKNRKNLDKSNCIKIPVAPYGGLFFHRNLLENIGFPIEEFFLYNDDTEWTYRITQSGGKIYLVTDSIIKDLENSWIFKKSSSFNIYLSSDSPQRLYYGVRNRVFFEKKNLVSNSFVYALNIVLYKVLLKLFYLKLRIFNSAEKNNLKRNLEIFYKAVDDGLKGKLEKNESINF